MSVQLSVPHSLKLRLTIVAQPVWHVVLQGGTVVVVQTLGGAIEVFSKMHSGTGPVQTGSTGQL